VYIYVCMYVCISIVYMYVCMYVCVYVHMCICVYVYMCICVYICIHPNILLLYRDQAPCSCLGLIDLTRVERLCLFNDISPPKRGFFLIPGLGLAGLPDLVGMGGWGGMVGAWAGVGAGVSGPPWSDPYQRLFIRYVMVYICMVLWYYGLIVLSYYCTIVLLYYPML
ncbi:hypothetical protein B484DRAFT_331549, partial [Ochromonadaceae sp. CCMP2298]